MLLRHVGKRPDRARFARPYEGRKEKSMTHGIVFYRGKKRIGRVHISKWCFSRMQEYQLASDQLEEVFRYGREIEENKLVYSLGDDLVTIIYVKEYTRIFRGDLNDIGFTLITCWKEVIR